MFGQWLIRKWDDIELGPVEKHDFFKPKTRLEIRKNVKTDSRQNHVFQPLPKKNTKFLGCSGPLDIARTI